MTFVIPLVFLQTPVSVGLLNAYNVLKSGSLIGDSVRVKSHQKFALDAVLLFVVQASIISYMAYTHGIARALGLWASYIFGVGSLFITFSQMSHIPCMTEHWRPMASKMKSWAAGQVEHSMNFAQNSTLAFYISFGLNFQIEHHLFPGISHDHYEALSPKIQAVCKKHGVEYWTEPSLCKSLSILYNAIVDLKEKDPVSYEYMTHKKTN